MARLLALFVLALAPSMLVAVPARAGQQSGALEAVDKYLADCHERLQNATPGFAVVLVDHDRVAYLKAFGVDSIFGRRPFSVDSVCPVGSLAESFTALAVMQLAQRGALDLDAPAVKYLPWFRTGDRERSDRITVRMLLNQTSGLPSREGWSFDEGSEEDAMEQAIRMFRAQKMSREPGQAYEPSNDGYTLAGLIIHRAAGMTYCDYLRSAILDPLKMKRSAADEEGLDRLHSLTGHLPGIDQAIPATFSYAPATIPSGSTLACSARDLGQYLMAMVNHGKLGDVQVIAPAALDEMMTPSIDFPCPVRYDDGGDRSTWHSGLGWIIAQIDGRRLVLQQGDTGLAGSIVLIDPARALAVGIVRNSSEVDPHRFPTLITMANNVLHLAGGESPTNFGVPRKPDPTLNNFRPTRDFLEKCVGSYISQTGSGRLDLALHPDGDGLSAKAPGGAVGGEALVDFRDETQFEFRNVRGTRHGFLRKLPDGSVAGFQLGAEKFRRMKKSVSEGYREVRAKDMRSIVIPIDWEVDWQGPSFTAAKPGDRRTVLEGGILFDCPHPLETLAEARHETGTVVENSPIIISAIGGMAWHQQASIVQRGDEKWQRLIAYIQFADKLVFITLRTPFGELTQEEQRILLPLMSAWGNDRFFGPVWSAVDVVPEAPRLK